MFYKKVKQQKLNSIRTGLFFGVSLTGGGGGGVEGVGVGGGWLNARPQPINPLVLALSILTLLMLIS